MTVKVVLEEPPELLLVVDVRAGGHEVTSGQILVKVRIVSPVQLIDGKLPDWVTSAGTIPSVTVTLVRHSVLQSVGPDWNPTERSSNGVQNASQVSR
jgi:hypothetical protein